MKKNTAILSFAAVAALAMSSPLVDKADAATFSTQTQEKVHVYHTSNLNDMNSMIEKYLADFGINISQAKAKQSEKTQTNQQAPAQKPTQQTSSKQHAAAQPSQQQPAAAESARGSSQTTGTLSAYEQKVVDLTNQERAKNGLPALKVDTTLSKMAHEKSRDMSANNYFSHTSPTYGSPFDMMKKYGISYSSAGENIAAGQKTPEEVVQAWMNSEGHRANILNANYNYIGVGYVAQGNYWTQEFIGK